MKIVSFGLVCGVFLSFIGSANANLVVNGSFENGTFAPPSNQTMSLAPGSTSIVGWTVVNDTIAWIGVGDPWELDAQDGSKFLDLSDYSAGVPFGGIRQDFATSPGQDYLVSFELGSSTKWGRPAALVVSAAGQSATFVGATIGSNNDWQHFEFNFSAVDGVTSLTFVGASGVNYIGLDNVNVATVPELNQFVLLSVGIIFLVWNANARKSVRV